MKKSGFINIVLLGLFFVACNSERLIEVESPPSQSGLQNLFGKWPSNRIQASTLPLIISDQFNAEETQTIENMGLVWQNAMNNDVSFFDNQFQILEGEDQKNNYTQLSQYNDNQMGIYKSTTWFSEASPFALAITQFFGIRRNAGTPVEYIELVHADIMVNYRDFVFSQNLSAGTYDFASVIIHELGHFLGLPHAGFFTESVMAPSIRRQLARRDLYDYDENTIRANYNLPALGAPALSEHGIVPIPRPHEGEPVHGIIELRADGTCRHLINGQVVHQH